MPSAPYRRTLSRWTRDLPEVATPTVSAELQGWPNDRVRIEAPNSGIHTFVGSVVWMETILRAEGYRKIAEETECNPLSKP